MLNNLFSKTNLYIVTILILAGCALFFHLNFLIPILFVLIMLLQDAFEAKTKSAKKND